jgi:[CysO sulfur-carrier protein]-S-L-cysteine hydrolase
VERFYAAEPDEPSPFYYRIESRDQIRIMNAIDEAGLDLVGIYHSHVASPAYPSRTDAEQAFWPDAVYVIVSLAGGDADVRGFHIRDMDVTEVPIEIG